MSNWRVALPERGFARAKYARVPAKPGVYVLYAEVGDKPKPLYVGSSKDLQRRLRYHFALTPHAAVDVVQIKYKQMRKQAQAELLELKLLIEFKRRGVLRANLSYGERVAKVVKTRSIVPPAKARAELQALVNAQLRAVKTITDCKGEKYAKMICLAAPKHNPIERVAYLQRAAEGCLAEREQEQQVASKLDDLLQEVTKL